MSVLKLKIAVIYLCGLNYNREMILQKKCRINRLCTIYIYIAMYNIIFIMLTGTCFLYHLGLYCCSPNYCSPHNAGKHTQNILHITTKCVLMVNYNNNDLSLKMFLACCGPDANCGCLVYSRKIRATISSLNIMSSRAITVIIIFLQILQIYVRSICSLYSFRALLMQPQLLL